MRSGTAARQILERMVAAYGKASFYQDRTQIQLRYAAGDQSIDQTITLAVALERPNRLRLDVSRNDTQMTVACDGQKVRCRIHDPASDNLDHQMVERSAPRELSVAWLYSVTEYLDPASPNELGSALMSLPVPMELTPLGLFLSGDPTGKLIDGALGLRQLADKVVDGRRALGVQLRTAAGDLLFWIDPETWLLRRVEYPASEILPPDTEDHGMAEAALVADFSQVGTGPIDQRHFQLERSPKAQVLRHFVLPPSADPAQQLGQRIGPYSFTRLDGQGISSSTWEGRLAVLIWFGDHPASRALLDQLAPVYERYRDDQRIVFWAISTEPTTAKSHRQIELLARNWSVHLPVVRDLDTCGRDIFKIDMAPTLLVVGPDRVVQVVEEGVDPELGQQLPVVLERLLAGEDVAGEFLRLAGEQRRVYHRHLAAASIEAPRADVPIPASEIADRSDPARLNIHRLWTCQELSEPGNILVSKYGDERPSIYVVEGWREIAQLDSEGKVRRRHTLNLPDDGAISFIRSGAEPNGRRFFVGCARLARQLFVFNEVWETVLSYPPSSQPHEGIQDVQLADLDEDGSLEMYVGFANILGVQRVDVTGNRSWSNRNVHSVLSLAVHSVRPRPLLLVTSLGGQIVPLDASGQRLPPITVGSRTIHHLVAGDWDQQRATAYCGISFSIDGHQVAIGMDRQMREVWSYDLPPGTYRTQIQYIAAGRVLDGPGYQWLMAGPNGTIHIVADDGSFADSFGYGEDVTGIASARVDSSHVLLIATSRGVTAWRCSGGR